MDLVTIPYLIGASLFMYSVCSDFCEKDWKHTRVTLWLGLVLMVASITPTIVSN